MIFSHEQAQVIVERATPTISEIALTFAGLAFIWFAHRFGKINDVVIKYFNGSPESIPSRMARLEDQITESTEGRTRWQQETSDTLTHRNNHAQKVLSRIEGKVDGIIVDRAEKMTEFATHPKRLEALEAAQQSRANAAHP